MYSLDVNFLKDRQVEKTLNSSEKAKSAGFSLGQNLPILIGLGVMVLLPAATSTLLLLLNSQTASMQQRIQELDAQIAQQGSQNQQVQEIEKQVNSVNEETQALVSVFTQIKPWSAVLQDIRDRVPAGVQIQSIKQNAAAAAPQGQGGSSSTPGLSLTISGMARSYNDVNDLILTLQQSSFLNAKKTVLTSAEEVEAPIQELNDEQRKEFESILRRIQAPGISPNTPLLQASLKDLYEFPKVVKYEIKTELGDIPASKLTRELSRKGAVGLVTRIRTLEQKGAIQP
jgi:type IV pilus assembly protein PilN